MAVLANKYTLFIVQLPVVFVATCVIPRRLPPLAVSAVGHF